MLGKFIEEIPLLTTRTGTTTININFPVGEKPHAETQRECD